MDPAKIAAWKTRRERYGERGHSGSYRRVQVESEAGRGALALVARLHVEGVLSEGQVASATGLSRIEVRKLADAARLKDKDHE